MSEYIVRVTPEKPQSSADIEMNLTSTSDIDQSYPSLTTDTRPDIIRTEDIPKLSKAFARAGLE